MNEHQPQPQGGGISPADVYFIIFRQKWVILACSLLGIVGAVLLLFVIKPPQYQSNAMISIRYVVQGKSLNPPGDQSDARPLDEQSVSIINTEIATLNSLDLAKDVARAISPEKILTAAGRKWQPGADNVDGAAFLISKGLTVEPIPQSSVIRITFLFPDPTLVRPILSEYIEAYKQQVERRQGLGVPGAFLTNEIARLKSQLAQTDVEISHIKGKAGVVSVAETQKAYAEQISQIRQEILSYKVALSGYEAVASKLSTVSDTSPKTTNVEPVAKIPGDEIDKYRQACVLIASLEAKEQNYLTAQGFSMENPLVKQVRAQIGQYRTVKTGIEQRYPGILQMDVQPSNSLIPQLGDGSIDLKTASQQVVLLKAKIEALNLQLSQAWADATNFDKVKTTIAELEQKRNLEAANLKYLQSNLEEAHIGESLGENRPTNIGIIQHPTPPGKGWSKKFEKKVAVVAVGGVLMGLGLAFLIEMFLDRSIKRPTEIEAKLHLPLFISVPDMVRNGRRRASLPDADGSQMEASGKNTLQPVVADSLNPQNPLRRFYEGLRDRLVVYFEVRNLVHKPKLVAVTSCGKGAGVSSIATGLAASLSETGEGNVLLVDMNVEGGAARHFHKGKPDCGLESALNTETKQKALVQENLYVASVPLRAEELPQVLPKRFAGLISQIRTSDYDYIIFDMPPVAETTMTFRLARLMDMTLLVIEAEKTNQEVVKRVVGLLAESKATVGTVLNKTRNYVPRRLHQEYLHDV